MIPNEPGVPAPHQPPHRTAGATSGPTVISCNVIAGLAHDHLFAGRGPGSQALALLGAL